MVEQPGGTVTVTGQASMRVAPGAAVVSVGVECTASSPAAALADCARRVDAVLAALERHGVAETDVRTGLLSVRQDLYEHSRQDTPFRADTTLQVRGVVVAEVGALLQAVLDAAGEAARVNGVELSAELDDGGRRALRAAAFADARASAEQFAELAGARLGTVLSVQEGGLAHGLGRRLAAGTAHAAAMPVAAGESEVGTVVEVCWRLAEVPAAEGRGRSDATSPDAARH